MAIVTKRDKEARAKGMTWEAEKFPKEPKQTPVKRPVVVKEKPKTLSKIMLDGHI
jgi:hypothetical protein